MLSALQQALAEAHGLAMAASDMLPQVAAQLPLQPPHALPADLDRLAADAADLRRRALDAAAAAAPDHAAEILAHAQSTRDRAADLAATWLRAGTGAFAAWAFLAMAEAGELATWTALDVLAATAADPVLAPLARHGRAVQQQHLALALAGAERLARLDDPAAPAPPA